MQFLSRPFVPGDSVQLEAAALKVTGTVEKIAPMRTMLRMDDDTLVSLPNKVQEGMREGGVVRDVGSRFIWGLGGRRKEERGEGEGARE